MAGHRAVRARCSPASYCLVQEGAGARRDDAAADARRDRPDHHVRDRRQGRARRVDDGARLQRRCVPARGAIVDLVGYGTRRTSSRARPHADALEHDRRPPRRGGCTDTDDNAADFAAGRRRRATPRRPLQFVQRGPTPPSVAGAASPPRSSTRAADAAHGRGHAGHEPAEHRAAVDLRPLGDRRLDARRAFFDDGTNGDVTARRQLRSRTGDRRRRDHARARRALPVAVTDAQGRAAPALDRAHGRRRRTRRRDPRHPGRGAHLAATPARSSRRTGHRHRAARRTASTCRTRARTRRRDLRGHLRLHRRRAPTVARRRRGPRQRRACRSSARAARRART